jgi:nuclear GTP-binding protein
MQEVQLDKNIVLLDSPGVVLSTQGQSDSLILRSAIKLEDLEDPIRPVEALLNRIERAEFCKLYGIEETFKGVEALLGHISRKKGYLKNGGVPNFDQAARKVIRDYQDGKMPYFTPAPDCGNAEDPEAEEVADYDMAFN